MARTQRPHSIAPEHGDVTSTLAAGPYQHGLSLLHGWVAPTVWAVAVVVLVLAIGWRSRRWRLLWLPVAALGRGRPRPRGALVHRFARDGRQSRTARRLWIWIGLTGLAAGVLVLGLARRALVAARRVGCWRCRCVCSCGAGAESVGGLFPDRADRLEPADRRPAARSDRPGDRHRDAGRQAVTVPPPRAPWCRSNIPDDGLEVSSTAANWSTCRRRGSPPIRRRSCRR